MTQNKNKQNIPSHITHGNVLDDLGFSPEVSFALKIKAELFNKILSTIDEGKYSPEELEKVLKEPRTRIIELLNGKASKIQIEKLLEYIYLLGGEVSLSLKE